MKQEHYGAVAFAAMISAALFVESLPVLSVVSLAVIAVCLFKGELWEIKEEKEKSPPRTRTGTNKCNYISSISLEERNVKRLYGESQKLDC